MGVAVGAGLPSGAPSGLLGAGGWMESGASYNPCVGHREMEQEQQALMGLWRPERGSRGGEEGGASGSGAVG